MTAWPHADLDLARRLERAEGPANAASGEARARLEPALGAAWIERGGVYAMYDGATSPLTQTFGLGIFSPVTEDSLEELEAFFLAREAPVFHEVSPFLPPEALSVLAARGYRPVEQSTVLIQPTDGVERAQSGIAVREIGSDDADLWARTSAEGWGSESPDLGAFIEAYARVLTRAEGAHCFLAEKDGRPIGTAAIVIDGDVGLLAGASTVPAARRLGAQAALLSHRLAFAADRGIPLAMVVALPGSGSQRNAERRGFRVAYTRTKWLLGGA